MSQPSAFPCIQSSPEESDAQPGLAGRSPRELPEVISEGRREECFTGTQVTS